MAVERLARGLEMGQQRPSVWENDRSIGVRYNECLERSMANAGLADLGLEVAPPPSEVVEFGLVCCKR